MKVEMIFDKNYGSVKHSVDADVVLMVESLQNRSLADGLHIDKTRKPAGWLFQESDYAIDENLIPKILSDLEQFSLDWSSIDLVGVQPSMEIVRGLVEHREDKAELHLAEGVNGFIVSKSPAVAEYTRLEQWRRNLPPRCGVQLTERALLKVAESHANIKRRRPNEDLVPCLGWGPRHIQTRDDGRWRDIGEGFTLGFFKREKVPAEAIENIESFEIIFQLGNREKFKNQKIDYVDGHFLLCESGL